MKYSYNIYIAIPLMAVLAVVQSSILPRFPIFGFVPILPLLVVVAWSLLRSPDEGVLWAFVAGFFLDLFSASPLGSQSLAMMLAVIAVTTAQRSLPVSRLWLPALLTAAATLIYLAVYLLLIRLAGFPIDWQIANPLPQLTLLHGFLAVPVYWLAMTINHRLTPRRIEV
jgi:rod shape-determining protein MreD